MDRSRSYSQEDSQWFLDLQRGLLEPQPGSYDEIVRRREAREARLAADPLEAARLGSDVLAFNSIPRISRTPSGTLPGHYVFDIFYIPIPPAADLLFIVQPGSTYSHCEQPIYCHRRPIEEQARAVVPALLRGFTSGLGGGSRPGEGFYPPMAPWDWLTPNEALQVAVELELKRVGVRPELCKVRVSKPEEARIHRECWEECNAAMLRVLGLTELPPEA